MFEDGWLMWCGIFGILGVMMFFGFVNRILDLFGKTLNRGTILLGVYMLVQKKWPKLPIPDKMKPKEKQPEDI